MRAKRPSYREAIAWIIANDDTEWLSDEQGHLSITASLLADLFGKTDEQVISDLRKAHKGN